MERRTDSRRPGEVWFGDSRQSRPNLPTERCPFCPGGLEAPEPYDVRWFANRWPPLPDGRGEVLLFCAEHDSSLAGLGVRRVRTVVDLWAHRTEVQAGRSDVAYVLIFENRGAEVGATISHPHGQLYALDSVPPAARAAFEHDTCAICAEMKDGYPVTECDGWRAVVPNAAAWPYELLIASDDHLPDLPTLSDRQRDALAGCLVDALGRLDALFDAPMPYMLWIHQRPSDGKSWPSAHVHVNVAPLYRKSGIPRFVAAGELGSGLYFNPLRPEEAAAELRTAGVGGQEG